MNGNSHILFDVHTACLTEQAMFDYIDGKLGPAECHAVEKHLLDCAFCSEAMEGLELVKNRKHVSSFIPPVSEGRGGGMGNPGRIIPFRFSSRLAAAAVIILLIGSLLVMRSFDKTPTPETAAKQEKKEFSPKPDSLNGDAPLTSDDQTFYRNFEPFPAREERSPAAAHETKKSISYFSREDEASKNSVSTSSANDAVSTLSPPPASPPAEEQERSTIPPAKADSKSEPKQEHAAPVSRSIAVLEKDKNVQLDRDELKKEVNGYYADSTSKQREVVRNEQADESKLKTEDFEQTTVQTRTSASKQKANKAEKGKETKAEKTDQGYVNTGENASQSPGVNIKDAGPEKTTGDATTDFLSQKNTEGKTNLHDSMKVPFAGLAGTQNQNSSAYNYKKVTETTDKAKKSSNNAGPDDKRRATENSQSAAGGSGTASAPEAKPVIVTIPQNLTTLNLATSIQNPLMEEAMKAYKEKDFPGAIDRFGKVLQSQPANVSALFYSGVAYLSLPVPDTKHAITNFDKVLLAGDAAYTEAAKWYKALALVKDNNTADAEPILNEMNNSNGVYREKAGKVLNDIQQTKKARKAEKK